MAQGFWGRRWCEHLESFSEYAARLAHGRAYVRNGSVCHLAIDAGGIDAMVVGSALYHVAIRIRQLDRTAWTAITSACAGAIGSVRDLREGRLPDRVVEVLTDRDAGLLPQPGEIVPECECSDRAPMCKHAAAALAGVGSRFDDHPELLFLLRGVEEEELIAGSPAPPGLDVVDSSPADGGREGAFAPDPGAGNGQSALREALPAAPTASSPPVPTPADPPALEAPPRRVKRTFTYRPPTATASRPGSAPADNGAGADEFLPTGELIVRLRELCGCSVAEFADLIQVTATTVRRWETTSGPLNLHARPWEALLALHLEIEKHEA